MTETITFGGGVGITIGGLVAIIVACVAIWRCCFGDNNFCRVFDWCKKKSSDKESDSSTTNKVCCNRHEPVPSARAAGEATTADTGDTPVSTVTSADVHLETVIESQPTVTPSTSDQTARPSAPPEHNNETAPLLPQPIQDNQSRDEEESQQCRETTSLLVQPIQESQSRDEEETPQCSGTTPPLPTQQPPAGEAMAVTGSTVNSADVHLGSGASKRDKVHGRQSPQHLLIPDTSGINVNMLLALANNIGTDWKQLATHLGFWAADIVIYECNYPRDLAEQAFSMFLHWWISMEGDQKRAQDELRESLQKICRDDMVVILQGASKRDKVHGRQSPQHLLTPDTSGINKKMLEFIAHNIGTDWEQLATHFGFQASEIDRFRLTYQDVRDQALMMLMSWWKLKWNIRGVHAELMESLVNIGRADLVETARDMSTW